MTTTGFDVQCNHYRGLTAQEIMQLSAFSWTSELQSLALEFPTVCYMR